MIFTTQAYADSLSKRGYEGVILQFFPNFHVSQLTGEFLNASTRDKVVETYMLLRMFRLTRENGGSFSAHPH